MIDWTEQVDYRIAIVIIYSSSNHSNSYMDLSIYRI
uniref:Vpu protein n=1 Tax=Human immunodeficiency virus type 1 TaxID=11676 RepID=Q8UT29_HV1|nr:vpu protein [Human immunodeficiency virus 1]